jgi:hypothetical protein
MGIGFPWLHGKRLIMNDEHHRHNELMYQCSYFSINPQMLKEKNALQLRETKPHPAQPASINSTSSDSSSVYSHAAITAHDVRTWLLMLGKHIDFHAGADQR